ncbi:MAG: hypothetical protein RJA70_5022 [Pseudomonadota bacterium]|jgi:gamma-glutamyl:cysteine ligase YbdK (ATP-grasp superfamily)
MTTPLHLFEGFGIELEYMIVDMESLDVRPIADELLKQVGGGYEREVDRGAVAWSNELALHVVEIKTNGPVPKLGGAQGPLQENIRQINSLLRPMNARLLPSAMHPWMRPDSETRLWPHEDNVIYNTFDRIFDCRGHGWANLQSMHINLPFANDDEFARLHAATRLVLPLLPGLAASSPFLEGAPAEHLDTRLEMYRGNARKVPSIAGHVIPERVFSRADYEGVLLQGIYDDLAPSDPDGVLREEWVNARGCIARFDRMAIEIRLMDVQECPGADLALAALVCATVRALVEEKWTPLKAQQAWDETVLAPVLLAGIRDAEQALVDSAAYLENFGMTSDMPVSFAQVWQHLADALLSTDPDYAKWKPFLDVVFSQGTLARRLRSAAGPAPSAETLREVYSRLADCLERGSPFSLGD